MCIVMAAPATLKNTCAKYGRQPSGRKIRARAQPDAEPEPELEPEAQTRRTQCLSWMWWLFKPFLAIRQAWWWLVAGTGAVAVSSYFIMAATGPATYNFKSTSNVLLGTGCIAVTFVLLVHARWNIWACCDKNRRLYSWSKPRVLGHLFSESFTLGEFRVTQTKFKRTTGPWGEWGDNENIPLLHREFTEGQLTRLRQLCEERLDEDGFIVPSQILTREWDSSRDKWTLKWSSYSKKEHGVNVAPSVCLQVKYVSAELDGDGDKLVLKKVPDQDTKDFWHLHQGGKFTTGYLVVRRKQLSACTVACDSWTLSDRLLVFTGRVPG